MLNIEWTESATKDLEKLDKPIARRILTRITWVSSNFERVIPEPLTGEFKGTFKLRIGEKFIKLSNVDCRIALY